MGSPAALLHPHRVRSRLIILSTVTGRMDKSKIAHHSGPHPRNQIMLCSELAFVCARFALKQHEEHIYISWTVDPRWWSPTSVPAVASMKFSSRQNARDQSKQWEQIRKAQHSAATATQRCLQINPRNDRYLRLQLLDWKLADLSSRVRHIRRRLIPWDANWPGVQKMIASSGG